jgi:arsenate reductase
MDGLSPVVSVLFLSTGNAARSPIAESVLLWVSNHRVVVESAGVLPLAEVHPMARVAVRKIFNGRIQIDRPRSFETVRDSHFDYVFTLSEEASEHRSSFFCRSQHVHWPLEDPAAAHGTRDQRQYAFDRVTRDLARRLRAWWPHQPAPPAPAGVRVSQARQSGAQAFWRTRPHGDAPLVAVAYLGSPRRCRNLCAWLERSGFHVVCGEKYGRLDQAMPILPDGVVVRVDGVAPQHAGLRPEFLAAQALRLDRPKLPILVLVDHAPSPSELEAMTLCGIPVLRRETRSGGAMLEALRALVQHSAVWAAWAFADSEILALLV